MNTSLLDQEGKVEAEESAQSVNIDLRHQWSGHMKNSDRKRERERDRLPGTSFVWTLQKARLIISLKIFHAHQVLESSFCLLIHY